MPGISVIVPVHNTVQYLERCVESILSQTFEDLEIILAENLSDDGSAELCDKLALRDNRIKVMHLDKAGPSYARNQALKICSSPYIGYVDRTFYSHYQRPESTCHTPSPSKIYDYFCAESGRIDYLDRYSTIPQETKDEKLERKRLFKIKYFWRFYKDTIAR